MRKVTTWRPDTCECELEYDWDTESDLASRVHTIVKIINACSAHSVETDMIKHYDLVLDENGRKNKVYEDILDNVSRLVGEITDVEGNTIKKLKDGTEFSWNFNQTRVLEVTLTGINDTERTALQTLADGKFGVNKVLIL